MIKNWNQFINESVGFSPRDIRVEREEFLDRESELKRVNFTDKEIESIKEITDFENSYLQLSHKLTPLTTGSMVSFNTLDGHFWVIVIKCEDEWYLIEERPKRTKWGQGSPGYLIADGFEQVEEFLKWYVGR